MTKAEFIQAERVHLEKAVQYRKKLGAKPFTSDKLFSIIGNNDVNAYYYELTQLIALGFIVKIESKGNPLLKITTDPIIRLSNIDITLIPLKKLVRDAQTEVNQLIENKELITTHSIKHKGTGN